MHIITKTHNLGKYQLYLSTKGEKFANWQTYFMEGHFCIRKMTRNDIPDVEKMHNELFPLRYSRRVYESFLTAEYLSLVLIHQIQDENRIIGVSTSHREWCSICSTKKDGYISTFGILPTYRRLGLGTFLFKVTALCLKNYYSCVSLKLHMLRSNTAAYEFYLANGFIVDVLLPNYYEFNNKKHDSFHMICTKDDFRLPFRDDIVIDKEVQYYCENTESLSWYHRIICDP